MNTIYYTLTSQDNGKNYVSFENVKVSKGKTELIIDISKLDNQNSNIIKVAVDFGDSSPIYERNYKFENDFDILNGLIKHIYYPNPNYHNVIYYPTVIITYSNFSQLVFQLTIKISKCSFFSDYKGIDISSIQFIDDEDDSIFTVLESLNGDILNLKIK